MFTAFVNPHWFGLSSSFKTYFFVKINCFHMKVFVFFLHFSYNHLSNAFPLILWMDEQMRIINN